MMTTNVFQLKTNIIVGPQRFHWSFWSGVIECDIRGTTFSGRKVDDFEEKNWTFIKSLETLEKSFRIGFTALRKILNV